MSFKNLSFILILFVFHHVRADIYVQDDTVKAPECNTVPKIDGSADDRCWSEVEWQTIDQVWIPYGANIDKADFEGKYKIVWSSETDKLYLLVEIVDDELVDGYEYPSGGWPDYDVVEIFIDEDRSGGDHTHNNNAFAYHITAGNSVKDYEVIDLQEGWDPVDFTDHVKMKIDVKEETYTWEIELTVYDDSYDADLEQNTPVELEVNKISGFSVAYCDNDDIFEEPKSRDHFFGSVYVSEENYNDHWKNASEFGVLKLVEAVPTHNHDLKKNAVQAVYPNPAEGFIFIKLNNQDTEKLRVRLIDITGKEIHLNNKMQFVQETIQLNVNDLATGYYFLEVITTKGSKIHKFFKK